MRKLFALLLGLVLAGSALAKEAAPAVPDPALEKRAVALEEQLRCLVCQNQTIADSQAELAMDLKKEIREKLKAGMSEKQITQFLVARYGDFVLYKPPIMATTVPLWFGPFVLLIAVVAGLFYYILRRRRVAAAAPLSEAEQARVQALLDASEERQ
ncbi:MAG: cytochrome c-type biogenesis protein [Burkholderiales bacterium]